ncbi:MAG: DUF1080 domain-containing protein, partial [Verrucomicrobiales bacterium]|nr:DUF1080 domain-containing protein [Verrucomicrobiales bacterium]
MNLWRVFLVVCLGWAGVSAGAPVELFDGETLEGWEGDAGVWRVRDGVIVGGSMEGNPQNEFLATVKDYRNFHLRLEYKIVGTDGFVNGGVQFRSVRTAEPANEMEGYQADIGAGYSGFLYDESRRRKFVAEAEKSLVETVEKAGEWNAYEIVAEGTQVSIFLNGQRTLTYVEREVGIADSGKVALQIHGNCKAEISFRNITIDELAARPVAAQGEIYRRFGEGQPGVALAGFEGGVFSLGENEVVALVGQENFVREQKAGEMESLLAAGLASKSPRFRPMAWEADTVYAQWR